MQSWVSVIRTCLPARKPGILLLVTKICPNTFTNSIEYVYKYSPVQKTEVNIEIKPPNVLTVYALH